MLTYTSKTAVSVVQTAKAADLTTYIKKEESAYIIQNGIYMKTPFHTIYASATEMLLAHQPVTAKILLQQILILLPQEVLNEGYTIKQANTSGARAEMHADQITFIISVLTVVK